MKKLFIFLCIACMTICNAAPTKPPNYIITKNNPTLNLTLPSNPTTGYSWFLISYNKSLLNLIGHKYTTSNNNKKLVGAGGYEAWKFRATRAALKAPHITYIKLAYARPWEIKANSLPKDLKITTIYVVIKP